MSDPNMIKMIVVMIFLTGIVVALVAGIVFNWLDSRKRNKSNSIPRGYRYNIPPPPPRDREI